MRAWIFLSLTVLLIALGVWLHRPSYTAADRDYYAALLCDVTVNGTQNDPRKAMRDLVENGNADYALHKIRFNGAAADDALQRFATLTPAQQKQAAHDTATCERLLRVQNPSTDSAR
ncbi:hypothetical protein [Paraburkholderia sp.]|uniref:hypothetical protein n=1 Tax=Paraburkholderia sp. TaxID=1926495 RepID=UPI0023A684D3|nr:hypothetical protein [Paraburkholderia sp.]MDE1179316.1 hypothetical protein [Paraburkholderia sp.]